MNSLNIIGRLTGDYEVKYTKDGKAIGQFSLAVDDGWGDNKHTSFYEVVTFGNRVEGHKQYIGKGSKVGISGSIKQDRWESQDGQKRSKVKITAMQIEYLDNKGNNAQTTTVADVDIPF